jgi:hypothetical protein
LQTKGYGMKKLRSICKDKTSAGTTSSLKTAGQHKKPSQIYICSTFDAIPVLTSSKMQNLIFEHTKKLLENLDE